MPSSERVTNPLHEYWLDAWQRSILFLDVLRRRGNTSREQAAKEAPNVLDFDVELVRDGRTLERPVNYLLVRIARPKGVKPDPRKRPFIIVDPRAGHGPGIGGMKKESEIGVAVEAGHPCYFIGFLPDPVPGQTIEDVCRAEAIFVDEVAALHPDAAGKPAIVANCQAGWQTMIMAATNPEVSGPILLAGSPLSYWAGVHGKNPLRYLGGALGGTWLTTLAGDLGAGLFDGANLVANFEAMNPANTIWEKPYNVYSNVDTEAERFLDFETWWGSPVLLNAEEMQWIADNLFVGNRLSTGALRTSDGLRIDLRNIRSPIIVFCSWGDDITPPQQALGWVTDIYNNDEELVANGQTIIYSLHPSIGHLGIFVSGKVATREHGEFAECMEMIDLAPPGLYEAVITDVGEGTDHAELIQGRYLFSLEARRLDDIRALGGNSPDDELSFAAAARLSDVNQQLYRTFVQPAVRAMTSPAGAETMRKLHPNRLRFSMFSDENPWMRTVAGLAEKVREDRRPAGDDNPFIAAERSVASWFSASLDQFGKARDAMTERLFLQTYGSPLTRAMVGLGPEPGTGHRHVERDLTREADAQKQRAELERKFEKGGLADALFRALIYVRAADGRVDERGFMLVKALYDKQPPGTLPKLQDIKQIVREQFLLLKLDEERAVKAIPKLLDIGPERRRAAFEGLRSVIEASGEPSEEARRRLARIEKLFNPGTGKPASKEATHA